MDADFKFRVDIRRDQAWIAWRCQCQDKPSSDQITVAPDKVLAWVNKLLNDHRPHARKPEPDPPAPTDIMSV